MVWNLRKGATQEELADLEQKLRQRQQKVPVKVLPAKAFCGVIKLKEDPLTIQKNLRNEWE